MSDAPTGTTSRALEAITVDLGLCKSCGICSDFCPQNVFETDAFGHPVVARLADCTGCSFCERHCPDFAIEIVRAAQAAGGDANGGDA